MGGGGETRKHRKSREAPPSIRVPITATGVRLKLRKLSCEQTLRKDVEVDGKAVRRKTRGRNQSI